MPNVEDSQRALVDCVEYLEGTADQGDNADSFPTDNLPRAFRRISEPVNDRANAHLDRSRCSRARMIPIISGNTFYVSERPPGILDVQPR